MRTHYPGDSIIRAFTIVFFLAVVALCIVSALAVGGYG